MDKGWPTSTSTHRSLTTRGIILFNSIQGGFNLRDEDKALVYKQRAITQQVNNTLVQVGAVWLKPSVKHPFDEEGWTRSMKGDVNLQSWIDDEQHRPLNVGFNLQLGWVDVDIDASDPEFNECIIAAMDYLKIDTRLRFGRKSVGCPTHVLVQLGEEESANFDALQRFEPKEFRLNGERFHVQLRSYSTNVSEKNLNKVAKQTVMPGSIYLSKKVSGEYDVSVWYKDGRVAENVHELAQTTPRRVNFNELVRAITFGTFLYVIRHHWVEGSRQSTAQKVTGWLARVVADSQAMNNHEVVSSDVFCPVDTDDIAESLIHFVCDYLGDDEKHMRARAYRDACEKLNRNPDARVPGWPAMEQMLGGEMTNALRTVFTPGSDVSVLTVMAERYIYDESDNRYIDRHRHKSFGNFVHEGSELERRHKGDVIRISGKPREAFKVFESSDMRKRVGMRDMFPDLQVGGIFRINSLNEVIPDDEDSDDSAMPVFNTWRGWPVQPTAVVNPVVMEQCERLIKRTLALLTRDNLNQVEWVLDWIAWIFQNPGTKQQIAWVVVGGQGVGKSFVGNVFMKALMGRLWGTASPNIIENNKFNVGPFKDAMFVFIDEAKFHGESGTDEIKKLIRSTDVPGMEKFEEARNYNIFARMMFASNRFDVNIGQRDARDRALFYTRAYDKDHLGMGDNEFRTWSETLKPFFDEFDAALKQREVREHFVRMFMDRKLDKHTIESVKYSSSSDPEIVESNMGWPRRIAKYIVEDGRILEDLSIDYPFTMPDFNKRVGEVCKELGMSNVVAQRVYNEFAEHNLIERFSYKNKIYLRFKYKYGTLIEEFGRAISATMDRRYEFTDQDLGVNTTTTDDRIPWKGGRVGVVQGHRV